MNKHVLIPLFIFLGTTSTYSASNETQTKTQEVENNPELIKESLTPTVAETVNNLKNGAVVSFSLKLGDPKPSDSNSSNAKIIFRRGARITTLSLATAALIHCYFKNEACLFLKACVGLGILNGFVEPVADTL